MSIEVNFRWSFSSKKSGRKLQKYKNDRKGKLIFLSSPFDCLLKYAP